MMINIDKILFFIDEFINDFKENIPQEPSFRRIANKYKFEVVDAYGSIYGKYIDIIPECFIGNTYGDEDWLEDHMFRFTMLFKTSYVIVTYNCKNESRIIEQYHVPEYISEMINLKEDVGGKRAFYAEPEHNRIRFNTHWDFYKKLKDENKFPDGEDDLSGPHLTMNFYSK